MPCGGRKTSHRTSSIVQVIFYFLSLEITGYILRDRKILIALDSYSSIAFYQFATFRYNSVFSSTALLKLENYSKVYSGFRRQILSGSPMRLA